MKAHKIIIICIILLFVIAVAIFFLWPTVQKNVPLPIFKTTAKTVLLKLDSSVDQTIVGKQFEVDLYFSSETNDVSSFDAVVTYDPEIVRVDEIKGSDMFPFYPRKLIEDFKSRFVVTGVQKSLKSELKAKSGIAAQVLVTPLKTGKIEFQFLIDGDKYTNVMNRNLENVLKSAVGTEVEVNEQ